MTVRESYIDRFFTCLRGACPDSCCRGWTVVIDSAAAVRFRTIANPELKTVADHLTVDADGDCIFVPRADGSCPMWDKDGLCRLYRQCGESVLAETCRRYPRLYEIYGGVREVAMDASCPAVFDLLYETDAPFSYTEYTDNALPEPHDIDPDKYRALLSLRTEMWRRLNGDEPLFSVVCDVLANVRAWQNRQKERSAIAAKNVTLRPERVLRQWGGFLQELEILNEKWKQKITFLQNFRGNIQKKSLPKDADRFYRRYLSMLIFQYFLRAVNDGRAVEMLKVPLFFTTILMALTPGGERDLLKENCLLMTRELAHSEQNLAAICAAMHRRRIFDDNHFIALWGT